MSLFAALNTAKSEEDVKDAYIKALGLKTYSKNLIDIQTQEIWFEAKDGYKNSSYQMFTQLLHYVQQAFDKGEDVPPFLCVIDTKKAAIMKTADALPLISNKKQPIKWGKNASGYTQEALDVVSAYIGTYLISFRIETHEDEFIQTIKNAIKTGDIIRTAITPNNLKQVFDKWIAMIGQEIQGVATEEYALLFFADIMSDGTVSTHQNLPAELLHKNNKPVFILGNKVYELSSHEGYRQFWAIYDRPPKQEYRNYLLERRDSLIPIDERSFKGAYYTPLHVVDKAYEKLEATLGKQWQKDYIVWDMCCGVGNLEVKHSNPRNVFMSTLDTADIDVMKATKTCTAATRFQYDYLNDDITDDGQIDYSLTGKVPAALQQAIKDGKKILILINPPYAEATTGITAKYSHKQEVSKSTKVATHFFKKDGMGSRELFTQFLIRIANEIPTATIAIFSKLKYVNAPNFEKFRDSWNAKFLDGFVVHSKAFDGLSGNFPIGFLVWKTNNTNNSVQNSPPLEGSGVVKNKYCFTEITVDVLDKNAKPIGEKQFYNLPNSVFLNDWITRPESNGQSIIPLKNAITPYTGKVLRTSGCENFLAFMVCKGNDLQNAGDSTFIMSSIYGSVGGMSINAENLSNAAVVFTVRRIIKHTWLNDRDQFLQPTQPLSDAFKHDCLLWMLFNGSNLTASADKLEWNGKRWSIVNHFIPFTENEVGANDRFESDFMVQYLQDKRLSIEAQTVMAEGLKLWQTYFMHTDVRGVRDELKLNRPDVGWYQIRKALQARNNSGDYVPTNFKPFEDAYKTLTEKLRPQVFELGFLR